MDQDNSYDGENDQWEQKYRKRLHASFDDDAYERFTRRVRQRPRPATFESTVGDVDILSVISKFLTIDEAADMALVNKGLSHITASALRTMKKVYVGLWTPAIRLLTNIEELYVEFMGSDAMDDDHVCAIIRNNPRLVSITMEDYPFSDAIAQTIATHPRPYTTINTVQSIFGADPQWCPTLLEAIPSFAATVTTLKLGCALNVDQVRAIGNSCRQVRVLCIQVADGVQGPHISTVVAGCRLLEELRVAFVGTSSGEGMFALPRNTHRLKLMHLGFAGSMGTTLTLGPPDAVQIASLCPDLESITVAGARSRMLSAQACHELATKTKLSRFPNNDELLNDAGMTYFAQNQRITAFHFVESSRLTGATLYALGTFLCGSLESLDISTSYPHPRATEDLVACLSRLRVLKRLTIAGFSFTADQSSLVHRGIGETLLQITMSGPVVADWLVPFLDGLRRVKLVRISFEDDPGPEASHAIVRSVCDRPNPARVIAMHGARSARVLRPRWKDTYPNTKFMLT